MSDVRRLFLFGEAATAIAASLLRMNEFPCRYLEAVMWMIQKIGVDADGEIDRVQWQRADTATNLWVDVAIIVPVVEVVDAILIGRVGSVIPVDGGGTVQGPYLRAIVRPGGVEGIEADPMHGEERTLWDLPRLRPGQIQPD